MKCAVCGRTLQEDARFCDFCGNSLPQKEEQKETSLNKKLLFLSILGSLGLTIVITLIAQGFGMPLFFGGLFLPFFFRSKSIKKQ